MPSRILAGPLLLCCLLSIASTPSERLGVTIPDFDYEDVSFTRRVLPALPEMEEALADVDIGRLLRECRRVVDRGSRLLERHRTMNELEPEAWDVIEQAYRLPWITCMVTVRRIGESGDARWADTLDELFTGWQRSVPGGWQRMHDGQNIHLFLNEETIAAYVKITKLDDLSPVEFVRSYRTIWEDGTARTVQGQAHGRVFQPYRRGEVQWPEEFVELFNDPSSAVRLHMLSTPTDAIPREARDLAVGQLADPDPEVRRVAAMKYQAGRPELGQEMVPALLRFLARDDIDEEAREAAETALFRRGYVPSTSATGLIAVPVKPGLQERHMNEDVSED